MQIKLSIDVGVAYNNEAAILHEEIQQILRLAQKSIIEKYSSRLIAVGNYTQGSYSTCGSATVSIEIASPIKVVQEEPVKS